MKKTSRVIVATLASVAALSATQPPARAAVTAKVGLLTCDVDKGWSFVFGSSRGLRCTYSGNGRTEHYSGDIAKFGVDVGYLKSGVIVWDVLAPTTNLAAGALTGAYGGVAVDASVGVGAGANALIGGSTHTLSLQPLSIEGDKGINFAVGIAEISLKLQP